MMSLNDISTADLITELAKRAAFTVDDLREELQAYDNGEARDEWPTLATVARQCLTG